MPKINKARLSNLVEFRTRNDPGPESIEWNERVALLFECDDDVEALADALLQALEALSPLRHAYVMVFRESPTPSRFWYRPPGVDISAFQALEELDPLVAARRQDRSGFLSLRDVAPPGFNDSELYRHFYLNYDIVDELVHAKERWRDLSVGAGVTKSATFTAEEIARHEAASPVIIAGLTRLAHLLDAEAGEEDLEKIAEVDSALDRFGNEVLTAREQDVVHLVLRGHNSESVAARLEIARNTVKRHRKRAYAKLGVTSQGQLFYEFLRTIGLHRDE